MHLLAIDLVKVVVFRQRLQMRFYEVYLPLHILSSDFASHWRRSTQYNAISIESSEMGISLKYPKSTIEKIVRVTVVHFIL